MHHSEAKIQKKLASVVAEDVIEPTVTDTVENHADDVHVHTEAECNVHVLMPSVNVSDELVSATTSDLSLDVATEAVAAVGRQFCQSSVAQEPESKASIPVNVLVPECESEAVEVFAVPVSELVPRTDRSHTDELELMMPEEKEIAVSLDVTDAGMSLEDLEMRPSTDDSEAAVQLGMQVLDANIEAGVSTIGAVVVVVVVVVVIVVETGPYGGVLVLLVVGVVAVGSRYQFRVVAVYSNHDNKHYCCD